MDTPQTDGNMIHLNKLHLHGATFRSLNGLAREGWETIGQLQLAFRHLAEENPSMLLTTYLEMENCGVGVSKELKTALENWEKRIYKFHPESSPGNKAAMVFLNKVLSGEYAHGGSIPSGYTFGREQGLKPDAGWALYTRLDRVGIIQYGHGKDRMAIHPDAQYTVSYAEEYTVGQAQVISTAATFLSHNPAATWSQYAPFHDIEADHEKKHFHITGIRMGSLLAGLDIREPGRSQALLKVREAQHALMCPRCIARAAADLRPEAECQWLTATTRIRQEEPYLQWSKLAIPNSPFVNL